MQRIRRQVTLGENIRVFIGTELAYSAEATFGDFVDNAADGEIGVYKVAPATLSDDAATLQTVALVAGEEYFITQMQVQPDGTRLVKKTPHYNFNDLTDKRREAFCLPVKQVSHVGYNGTSGNLGDNVIAIVPGDIFSISILETTEGYQPFPTWNYEYQAKAGDTLVEVVAGLVANINDVNALTNKENPPEVVAAVESVGSGNGTAGNEVGIRLTALSDQFSFAIAVKENLRDSLITKTTPMKWGSGFREDVVYVEYEGHIFDGTTTKNAQFKDEWGDQVKYARATLAYDYIHLDNNKRFEDKGTKRTQGNQDSNILIAAPITAGASAPYVNAGASPVANLITIFGL